MKLVAVALFYSLTVFSTFSFATDPDDPSKLKAGPGIKKAKVAAEVVGRDDRQKMTSDKSPWSAIGRINFVTDKGANHCTGNLVDRDIVITNAHCIENSDGSIASSIVFRPNYKEATYTYESYANLIWRGKQKVGKDWAILRLRSPLGDSFGWLGTRSVDLEDLGKESWEKKFILAGYSADFEKGETAGAHVGCTLSDKDLDNEGAFLHYCDTFGGSSGGAIFGIWDGEPYVVGLNSHESGGKGYNYGVLTSVFSKTLKDVKKGDEGRPEETYVQLCNSSSSASISTAIAYYDTDNWVSKGWYTVAKSTCKEVLIKDSYTGDVYVRGEAKGVIWGKEQTFCVGDNAFGAASADKACNGRWAKFNKFAVTHGKVNPYILR